MKVWLSLKIIGRGSCKQNAKKSWAAVGLSDRETIILATYQVDKGNELPARARLQPDVLTHEPTSALTQNWSVR